MNPPPNQPDHIDCPTGAACTARISSLIESDTRQWEAIDRLRNRLPLWATTTIALLSAASGAMTSYIIILTNGHPGV